MSSKDVSIVIAVYNGQDVIKEQMNSLLGQTYPIKEVIIIDDCSTDTSEAVIRKYIEENKLNEHWRYIRNEKNIGYANNFRKGTLLARGDYIFFCDQDDRWYSNKIEDMVDLMEKDSNIQLLCTEYRPFFTTKKNVGNAVKRQEMTGKIEHKERTTRNLFLQAEGCTMGFRKKLIDEHKHLWREGWAHDDFIWKMAILEDGCFIWHKALIDRRFHEGNATNNYLGTKEKRKAFFERGIRYSQVILNEFADSYSDGEPYRIVKRYNNFFQLRFGLVFEHAYRNAFILFLSYRDCYPTAKSYIRDVIEAVR